MIICSDIQKHLMDVNVARCMNAETNRLRINLLPFHLNLTGPSLFWGQRHVTHNIVSHDPISLFVFFLSCCFFVFFLAGYLIINIEGRPFASICCLLTWCWEQRGGQQFWRRGGREDSIRVNMGEKKKTTGGGTHSEVMWRHFLLWVSLQL